MKRVESFLGTVSESEAETLMDWLSSDQKFWNIIKAGLVEGKGCQEIGYEIILRCEAVLEELGNEIREMRMHPESPIEDQDEHEEGIMA